jgi:hypothetical protein
MAVNRWFVRCFDCCAVAAVDRNPMEMQYWQGLKTHEAYKGPSCSCGGRMENMGRVQGDRLLREDMRCACDSRCTNASGPNCDCVCQGANHGTNRMVCVKVDNGAVPVVQAGSVERAAEFREALKAAQARVDALPFAADMAAGRWVSDRAAWDRVNAARHQLRKARSYKTHAKRMSYIQAVAA